MAIPLNIMGIGINDIGFADAVITIDFKHHFYIGLYAEVYVKFYFSPAYIELIIVIIDPLKIAA